LTSIGPADQVMLLLSEQLKAADRGKAKKNERTARAVRTGPRERLAALAAIEDLPERDLRRAVVRGLLAERLGEELVADPAFAAAALEITRIIEESPEGEALLDRAAAALKKTG
jgi:hypothetical protein